MSNVIGGMSNEMISLRIRIAMIVFEVLGRSRGSLGFLNVKVTRNSRVNDQEECAQLEMRDVMT